MKLKIKSLKLENFRGIKQKTITLDGEDAIISGRNGSGKTTIGMCLGWVIADSDLNLNKNPNVTPLGASEVVTRVEIDFLLDDKPLKVAKSQKFKSKTEDDKTVSSITNTYEINSVEKAYRDFIADLNDRGIDVDKFLILTNPNAFMSDTSKSGREKMRNILFEMASDISDTDLLKEMKNVKELKTLLEDGYRLDEVESMNKTTLKKITEVMGKDNCIAQGKISGIIASKVDVDVKSLEKTKAEYESELESVRETFKNLTKGDNEIKSKIAQYEGDLIEIEKNERISIEEKIAKASQKLRKAEEDRRLAENDEYMARMDEQTNSEELRRYKESLDNYRNLYKEVQSEKLDADSTKCPSCGREYPKEQIAQMRKDFEDGKAKRLSEYKAKGEEFAKKVEEAQKKCDESRAKYEKANAKWKAADSKVDKYGTELASISRNPDLTKNEKYVQIRSEIDNLKDELLKKGDLKIQELSNRESYLITMIKQVIGDLSVANRNSELDEQVSEIREQIKQSEIKRANAEKILDQVDRFKRFKDEKLTSEINKYFRIINWHLSEVQKNGDIKEVCEPFIGDKSLFRHSNQALQVVAKCDIIRALSTFYGAEYPVILDDSSLLTEESIKQIEMPNQLIWLYAKDGIKELTIERR